MNATQFSHALGKVNDKYIMEAITYERKKKSGWLKWGAIIHCGLLPVDEDRTTDFGGVPVTLSHCSMKHGPFDPTKKAADGLSNMPAGYYDIYTASFTLDGVEYEVLAQRLEVEEVIKIVASVINMPCSENFVVGRSEGIPDKGSMSAEYPDTAIVPSLDLDEPSEQVEP